MSESDPSGLPSLSVSSENMDTGESLLLVTSSLQQVPSVAPLLELMVRLRELLEGFRISSIMKDVTAEVCPVWPRQVDSFNNEHV